MSLAKTIIQQLNEGQDDYWSDPEGRFRSTTFANPGGNSALRAAGKGNPRNLPCPTCKEPNKLTRKDKALGYQCDACADRDEGGYGY